MLKLDIQGSEMAAIRGMSGLFERHWPVRMLLEFWPYGLEDCGSSADELLGLLGFYFSRFWIIWPHCRRSQPRWRICGAWQAKSVARPQVLADIVALQATDQAPHDNGKLATAN